MSNTKIFNLAIGQTVKFEQVPFEAEVIGIDHYTMDAFDGERRIWTSYTLACREAPPENPWNRWWAVNVPEIGPHFYTAARNPKPLGNAIFDDRLSGLVHLASEGNSDLSGKAGALATYTYPDRPGTYAQETFPRQPLLIFDGIPYDV